MATKELVKRLAFRRIQLLPSEVSKITVRYGTEVKTSPGHATCRKFIKNYLPVILYNNPAVLALVERSEELNACPSVSILRSDGTEQSFDTKALAVDFPKAGDQELFRRITGSSATLETVKAPKKKRKQKKAIAPVTAPEEEGEGDAEPGVVPSPSSGAPTAPVKAQR